MVLAASETRAVALRVARILRERGRTEEAVQILCAGAAAFANDQEGQDLLAEALNADPNNALAKMAFERMEGVAGQHAPLEAVIARYTGEELTKLERSLRPGVFLRAQVGFNNNIKYKGAEYHVQTEDSGLDKPHIITHLFADGGRVIKSHKRNYGAEVSRSDVTNYVRGLMKGQHMEMVLQLRDGSFDEIIAARAPGGGMDILEHAPQVDLQRIGSKGKPATPAAGVAPATVSRQASSVAASPPSQASSSADVPLVTKKPSALRPTTAPIQRARLHVTRSLHGGPLFYDMVGDEVTFGAAGSVKLEGESFVHPREATLRFEGGAFVLQDLDGGNGVFVRIGRRVEISLGDEFVIGDQLLVIERNPDHRDGPAPGPTYFRSSLKWSSAFRVSQVFEGGAIGTVAMARGTMLQIGGAPDYANDMVLRGDPLIGAYHCIIEEQADSFILTDLGASSSHGRGSGVFVRVTGKHPLQHADEVLLGRTRLQLDISSTDPHQKPLG